MKTYKGKFYPKDGTDVFDHTISAFGLTDAKEFFEQLSSVWNGKFKDIHEVTE